MKKRMLAALLAACMLLGNASAAMAGQVQGEVLAETESAPESEADAKTEDPSETEAVSETESPSEPETSPEREDSGKSDASRNQAAEEKSDRDSEEKAAAPAEDPSKENSAQIGDKGDAAEENKAAGDEKGAEGEKGSETEAVEETEPVQRSVTEKTAEDHSSDTRKTGSRESEEAAADQGQADKNTNAADRKQTEKDGSEDKETDQSGKKDQSDLQADPSQDLVWEKGHADLIQAGDLVAEHFPAEEEQEDPAQKAAKNALKRSAALTKAQTIAGLKSRFSKAFSSFQASVDVSDLDLYLKDFNEDGLDGEAVITEAYQTAVAGENFYITGDFKIGANEETGQILKVSIGYGKSFQKAGSAADGALPLPDTAAIKKAVKELKAAVAAAKEMISTGKNDLEKVLLLHDYLAASCSFDFGGNGSSRYYPDEDYTAYGALVRGKAVCNGYAFAFSMLAQSYGIETYIMASEAMDHAWNLVKISGVWYHVDVTRDDPVFGKGITFFGMNNADAADEGYVSHQFFLKSDGEMRSYGYSKWAVQASSQAVPAASSGSSYKGYLFRKYPDAVFGKISGKWYLGALSAHKILKASSLKTDSASGVYTDKALLYAIPREEKVWLCRQDGVFAWDPAEKKLLAVSLYDGDKQKVSELGIRNGKLYWLLQGEDGSTDRSQLSLSGLKTREAKGWLSLADGSLKYFKKGKALKGRKKIGGSWYYLDKTTGIRRTGWIRDGKYRYYFDKKSGKALTGWQVIGKKGYYFKKSNGRALTGKRRIGGRRYTFSKKGVLKKSPAKVLTGKYFFNKKGRPVKGWKKIGSKKYYFSKKTYRYKTGLVKIGRYRYYFNRKGVMKTGFRTIDGRKYYFKSNGRMDAGWIETADGNLQYMNGGKTVKGLQTIYGKEFYFNSKGYLQTGLVTLQGKTCYFLTNGGRAKDRYVTVTNGDGTKKLAYFGSDGIRVTGKQTVGGNTLYLLANDGRLSAGEKRQALVSMALYYLKTKQGSAGHHKLVDTYNALPSSWKRKYTVTYKDQWCATAVSAWGILCGMEELLLPECSCRVMVKNFKSIGRWQEKDSYIPQMGDIVMYDWQDKGKGDNTGTPDHVGIVLNTFVRNGDTYFRVIEGNCAFNITTGNVISSAEKKAGKGVDGVTYFRGVGIRTMKVNARYIRGFCLPAY